MECKMKSFVFLTFIVSAVGQNFIQTHTNNNLESGQSVACHYVTDATIGNTKSGTMTTTWFGNFVAFLLDWDGNYNYADVRPDTGSNGATYEGKFSNSHSGVSDNNAQNFGYGTKPVTIAQCQQRCLDSDNCMVVNHEDDINRNWMCNLQPVCGFPRLAGELPTGRAITGFVKLTYSTFTALEAKPGTTCPEVAVFGPSTLGKSTPVNPVDCHAKCALELRAPYFMIDRELKCTCYNSCSYVTMTGTVDSNTASYSTVFHTSLSPTESPTPAPSKSPTKNPTMPPTDPPVPQGTPTNAPTTEPPVVPPGQPTNAPTRKPTPQPTNPPVPTAAPPPTAPAADDDSNQTVILGGFAGAAVLILGGFAYYKWNSNGSGQGGGGRGRGGRGNTYRTRTVNFF